MSLAISVDRSGAPPVVVVDGELDLTTVPDLLSTATDLIDSGHRRLVLDLGDLTFCDSAGLSAFARLTRRLDELDGLLALARPTPIVDSVLRITGMAALIPTFSSVDEARSAARV